MKTHEYAPAPAGASPIFAAAAREAWTTRFDPVITRRFGVEEIHSAVFMPDGWRPGIGAATVTLLIPELELQTLVILPDGQPLVMIQRAAGNANAKRRLRDACALAADRKASLSLGCDTAQQADLAARRAARWLPASYSRVALERMYDPETRIRKNLS
jgi:hypothetical protein